MCTRSALLLFAAFCFLPFRGLAAEPHLPPLQMEFASLDELLLSMEWQAADSVAGKEENTRLISSALAVLLGPFGAHRLYLGTNTRVAVVYGLTFGGFGVLALLDLGHLLLTKDLAPYRNNDQVFMWGKGATAPTPQ